LLHADIAVLVGGRTSEKDDVEREGLEAKILLAIDRHVLDRIVLGTGALAGTTGAGITKV
jgi:hypothetical protein